MVMRNMVGSLRRKGEDRWECRLRVRRGTTWGEVSRTVRGSREQAEAELARLAAEHGIAPVGHRVVDVLEAWFAWSKPRRTVRSNAEVRRNIDRHLSPALGALRLAALTVGDIEGVYQRLQHERALSGQTVRHLHHVLQPALRMAVRRGWRADNPAAGVELPPLHRIPVEPPSVAQVRQLMESVELTDPKLALYLRLLVVTGTRRSEAAAFQGRDVDWPGRRIHVARALSETKGALAVKETKTGRQRWVSVDDSTLRQLDVHLDQRRLGRTVRNLNPQDWIFPARQHGPTWPGTWSTRFIHVRNALGFKFRLHDLRHHHASVLLDEGVAVQVVAARLGHARTSTTTDVYGHLLRSDDGGAAGIVAGLYDE
jgi:integrase